MKTEKKKFSKAPIGDKVFIIFIYVLLTLAMLIVLLPLIYIVSASFSDSQAVIANEVWLLPVRPTLRGYEAVFKNKNILTGFSNSFFYMIVGTAVNILMTILCAFPLSRKEFTARNKVAMIFIFTMYFSGGLVPSYMLVNKLGLVNTRWALIIPSAMSTYFMIICRTYFINSIPDELYEAGQIDGCTPFKYLLRIVIPLSKPIIAVLTLYYGVGKWNSYFDAMIYLKDQTLVPLQVVLRDILILNKIDYTMISDASALAAQRGLTDLLKYSTIVVASVPVLCIYPFVQKHFVKGVMIGAVKG
ncbi:carbohydrate ABC transporter permease [Lachnoclostridium phytofermentans]|uniref:Binding-protein-dependent transport systems inner membrane component n=1 Tax=Lachnoclostridium phytofermentans (strain ATCC 700394 / DSM 18823 / ISDg) TaxID=357809 RepID=A9KJY5_LACP7|nr:carbohydrate ABC transporter permease [Lachnoclostridium phytofermentans]ABX42557.1 binding-protein-dependent transport systems inner membrane component [Lachnoclostridium phytofermentans ISDg]